MKRLKVIVKMMEMTIDNRNLINRILIETIPIPVITVHQEATAIMSVIITVPLEIEEVHLNNNLLILLTDLLTEIAPETGTAIGTEGQVVAGADMEEVLPPVAIVNLQLGESKYCVFDPSFSILMLFTVIILLPVEDVVEVQ
jgi:hypothetical protein